MDPGVRAVHAATRRPATGLVAGLTRWRRSHLRYDAAARPLAQATSDAGHHVIAAAVRRTFVMGETGTGSA